MVYCGTWRNTTGLADDLNVSQKAAVRRDIERKLTAYILAMSPQQQKDFLEYLRIREASLSDEERRLFDIYLQTSGTPHPGALHGIEAAGLGWVQIASAAIQVAGAAGMAAWQTHEAKKERKRTEKQAKQAAAAEAAQLEALKTSAGAKLSKASAAGTSSNALLYGAAAVVGGGLLLLLVLKK
jgi:hypothetical protein